MVKSLAAAALVFCVCVKGAGAAPSVGEMLREFKEAYGEAAPGSAAFVVGIEISSPEESWHVEISKGGDVHLRKGAPSSPAMIIRMSRETLGRIHSGAITAFTAGAKASGADAAPLELEFHPAAQELEDPKGMLLAFVQHFFVHSRPERILLGEEHSRIVHGAHSIPLYYATGFRSAWYMIKEGQRLNEPGDTNPFPQAFVIVSGRGRAKIGNAEVDVRAGESYYIPPGSDHVLWPAAGEPLELIWLAWGEGA